MLIRDGEFARESGQGIRPTGPKPKPKPKQKQPRWSHQNELDGLRGQRVVLFFKDNSSAQTVCGTLVAADQFTIKLAHSHNSRIYFKHALIGFHAEQAA